MRKTPPKKRDSLRPTGKRPTEEIKAVTISPEDLDKTITKIAHRTGLIFSDVFRQKLEVVFDQKLQGLNKLSETREEQTNKATAIGALATFYAMAAFFFFAGFDIFEVFKDHFNFVDLGTRMFYYRIGGVLEIIAVCTSVPGIFFLKSKHQKKLGRKWPIIGDKIEKGIILLMISMGIGIGGLASIALLILINP